MNPPTLIYAIVYAAFVSLGLPDGALGVAWPSMRAELGRPLEALGLVTILGTIGSALSGLASGRVLARLGTPRVVLLSGLLTGFSLMGFAFAGSYAAVILLALPLGFGAGSVDTGLNHYAAERFASRHMNWLHASWGIGATMGPLAVTAAAAAGAGWRGGYAVIAIEQLALSAMFLATLGKWEGAPARQESRGGRVDGIDRTRAPSGSKRERLALFLAPACYALYAGAELGMGAWAASALREGRGLDPALAGSIAAAYYGSITAGRVVSGIFSDRVGNRLMVRLGLGLSAAGLLVFALPLGPAGALAGIAMTGAGLAPVYPCLMHETPRRFDPEATRRTVGRQVAGSYVGGMLLPPLVGVAAASLGLGAVAPVVGAFLGLLALAVAALDRLT